MSAIPNWRLAGDWFDICSCDIPCPCEFAQAPTNNACTGMLAWHVRKGHYGDVRLEGLNLLGLGAFEGNIWADEGKVRMGLFIDERADEGQRHRWERAIARNISLTRPIDERRSVASGLRWGAWNESFGSLSDDGRADRTTNCGAGSPRTWPTAPHARRAGC